MSHTAKTHTTFWRSMAERFGNRWFDVNGKLPSKAWTDLLDQFALEEIEAAQLRLKDRAERERAHPPTHAEFQALLVSVQRTRGVEDAMPTRSYWRSVTVGTCLRCAALLNLVKWGEKNLEALPDAVYKLAFSMCNEFVVWAVAHEGQEGYTRKSMEQHINSSIWNTLKPWARHGENDVSHLSADTTGAPRGTSEQLTLRE